VNDARLIVPPLETPDLSWPTLGPEVCDHIEDLLVHGPGDLLGEDIELTDEERLFIYRAYEVYPCDHPLAGRRRFKRIVLSRRKGVGKTEVAALVAIEEMDPTAPVRCDGWRKEDGVWVPVGRPIRDPYIPMVSTTEEQTEDLAFGAVNAILSNERCGLVNDYDVSLTKIVHKRAPGKMQALSSAPSARDGARTTFEHFDETHLFTEPRLKNAHATMLRNIPKRKDSDAWSLETTTMYAPGEDSVAEGSHKYALQVQQGRVTDATLYFDHRQASEAHDLSTKRGLVAAIREASGDAWAWADPEAIIGQFRDPQVHESDFRRYWLNQPRKSATRWLGAGVWEALSEDRAVSEGGSIVLGFGGLPLREATVLLGCTVEKKPHVFLVQAWERPMTAPVSWRTPQADVEEAIREAMERWEVIEFNCFHQGWTREVDDWEATYGDRVVRFDSNQPKRLGEAVDALYQAIAEKQVTHDGSEVLTRHMSNAVSQTVRGYDVITHGAGDTPADILAAKVACVTYRRAVFNVSESEPLFAFA
jgi:Ni/Co efflux regulator RcnB